MTTGRSGDDAEEAQHAVAAAVGRRRGPGISSESNFSEPVTMTRARVGADVDDAPGRLVALHAEPVDVRRARGGRTAAPSR